MAVKATLAIAALIAIAIAMLLPMPGKHAEARNSTIPTMEVGKG